MAEVFSLVVSLLNLLGLGGVGLGLWFIFRGLKDRIGALEETVKAAKMRADELDKLRESYKQALFDFEEMGKKLEERRAEVVKELEAAIKQKDEQLQRLTKVKLEQLDLQQQSFQRLPELVESVRQVTEELESHLTRLIPVAPLPPPTDHAVSLLRLATASYPSPFEDVSIDTARRAVRAAVLDYWASSTAEKILPIETPRRDDDVQKRQRQKACLNGPTCTPPRLTDFGKGAY